MLRIVCAAFLYAAAVQPVWSQDLPIPRERPQAVESKPAETDPVIEPDAGAGSVQPIRDLACEKRISALGVKFKVLEAENGDGVCGVAYPIAIEELPGNITVKPETKLNCSTVEALAGWIEKSVVPAVSAWNSGCRTGARRAMP